MVKIILIGDITGVILKGIQDTWDNYRKDKNDDYV